MLLGTDSEHESNLKEVTCLGLPYSYHTNQDFRLRDFIPTVADEAVQAHQAHQ